MKTLQNDALRRAQRLCYDKPALFFFLESRSWICIGQGVAAGDSSPDRAYTRWQTESAYRSISLRKLLEL